MKHNSTYQPVSAKVHCTVVIILVSFSLVANGLSIYVMARANRSTLKKILYRFIFSLSISNLIAGACAAPFYAIEELYIDWSFGSVMCKIVEYTDHMTHGNAVLTHALIALERHDVITRLLQPRITPKCANKMIIFSWIFPAIIFLPHFHMFEVISVDGVRSCSHTPLESVIADKIYRFVKIITQFTIPLSIIIIANYKVTTTLRARRRNRIGESSNQRDHGNAYHKITIRMTKLALSAVIIFLICALPNTIMRFEYLIYDREFHRHSTLYETAIISSFISQAITPLLFFVFDKNFSKYVLRWCFCTVTNEAEESVNEDFRRYSSRLRRGESTLSEAVNDTPDLTSPKYTTDGKEARHGNAKDCETDHENSTDRRTSVYEPTEGKRPDENMILCVKEIGASSAAKNEK